MKQVPGATICQRIGALALTVFFLLPFGAALMQSAQPPLTLTVIWTDMDGTPMQKPAQPLPFPGYENAFWLYVSPEAMDDPDAQLVITDELGSFPGGFAPPSGTLLSQLGIVDTGSAPYVPSVEIYGLGNDNSALAMFPLYISLSAEEPETPEEPIETPPPEPTAPPVIEIPPAVVLIHYVDQQGNEFAFDQTTLEAGQHTVRPNASRVPDGYQLAGQGEYTVLVTQSGAEPQEVTFVYDAPVQPAVIQIRYLGAEGEELGLEQRTLSPGQNTVRPNAAYVPEGAQLNGQGEYTVTVTQSGAQPDEVTFIYQLPVQQAQVGIRFLDQEGNAVASPKSLTLGPGTHEIYAQPDDLAPNYQLAGPDVQTVTVNREGASPSEVDFVYSKVMPEPTAQSALVTVRYLDEGMSPVAQEGTLLLQPGTREVTPTPSDLLPGYELISAPSVQVVVDKNGATPNVVTFYYRQTPSVSFPVDIRIRYVDESGTPVASDTVQSMPEGKNAVRPNPIDLQDGYVLADEEIKYVTVSENQADPESLVFVYQLSEKPQTPTPPPAPKVALVNILYRMEDGTVFHQETAPAKEGEDTAVTVDYTLIDSEIFQLLGPETVLVTVNGEGVPTPGEVAFTFRDISLKKAVITLRYLDENGNEVSPVQTAQIAVGTTQVMAAPTNLPNGMTLISESPVAVTLSETGVLSQDEVIFRYRKQDAQTPVPTLTPEPTALPFELTTMDRYGYPDGDTVNFRSSPQVQGDSNVIMVTSRNDLAHILGSVKNQQGEEWYLADINGREGFLKASIVRLLSFSEAAELFGWTPTPAPSPTPPTEQLADNEPIDRWGEVTDPKGVNFRTKASTGATKISQLEQGERFWVYNQVTVGKDIWYSVMVNNKKGHVMASYTRLYSQQESAQYQATLPTPMPVTVTDTPTQPPVTVAPATPTPEPPEQTVLPQPTAYHGYALVTRQAALRQGAGQQDELVLDLLQANTLVYVWSQTTLGSDMWSNVQVMENNMNGYLQNTALRYINDQEAAYYQSQLNPQGSPTPSPSPVPAQKTGYALTLGENVPLRAYADTNAQILGLLPDRAVVSVMGQEYSQNNAWHLVQSAAGYGFVRQDQMRMMNPQEERAYLESLRTPVPTPNATLAPVTLNSPSSYGYVNADRVRLRSGPSRTSKEIKLMSANAFALVYGSTQQPDGLWYHISQDGTSGYVDSNFFTVLPMGELSAYLQSAAYLNSANAAQPQNGARQPVIITPVEDFNNTVWQNPNLVNPSYEPFNPLGTPTPSPEDIFTPSPEPSGVLSPSPSILEEFTVAPPEKADSSFPTGLLITGLIAVLGGGGYYGYHLYQENQKKAVQRAAQRRAQMAQQSGTPQARPVQPISPYAPPQAGVPGGAYRPGGEPQTSGQPSAPQGTVNYRPGAAPQGMGQPGMPPQGTQGYKPAVAPPPQGTINYKPGAAPQGNRPSGATPQNTTGYRPSGAPPEGSSGNSANKPQAPGNTPNEKAPGFPDDHPQSEARRRRSDKHN